MPLLKSASGTATRAITAIAWCALPLIVLSQNGASAKVIRVGTPIVVDDPPPLSISARHQVPFGIDLAGLPEGGLVAAFTRRRDQGLCRHGETRCRKDADCPSDDGPCIYFSDIYANRYDEDGLWQAGFQVSSNKPAHNYAPAIASGANEEFVIAWQHIAPNYSGGIVTRSYAGEHPTTPEVHVSEARGNDSYKSEIAHDAKRNEFVVVWTNYPYWILARRIRPSGKRIANPFVAGAPPYPVEPSDPSVDVFPDGGFVVVWDGNYRGATSGQRVHEDGRPDGPKFQVSEDREGTGSSDVCVNDDGSYIVAYDAALPDSGFFSEEGVWAQRYDRHGAPQGSKIVVAQPSDFFHGGTHVVCEEDGFFVVWREFLNVRARHYFSSGVADGPSFPVDVSGRQAGLPIAAATISDRQIAIAWRRPDNDQSQFSTLMQRFEFGPGNNCRGDCDLDDTVGVDDLTVAVRIAMGNEALDTCALADSDGDGSVTVNDLVAALENAMRSCSSEGSNVESSR